MPAMQFPRWLTSPGQYFFETNPQKRALEVLCVKLSLLSNLCSLIADEHERTHRSRGVIAPEHILVRFPEHRPAILPTRWSASLSLAAAGCDNAAFSVANMPEEMARNLIAMPERVNLVYAAPLVRDWPLGRKVSVTALVQSADPIPDDDQVMKGLVRVHVIADGLSSRDFSDRDVFRVSLPINGSRGACMELWARKVESAERGIIMSGTTDVVSLDSWKLFTRTLGDVRSSAEVAVYRAYSPAHDVYSFGMLLLRALLGSDKSRWARAGEQFCSITEGLEPIVQGIAEDDDYTIHLRVRDRLRESADCFEPGAGPEVLWWDSLIAVLRACSRIQGFSYAGDAVLSEPNPARLLGRDLVSLARRARTEIFEARERDAMILRACDRAMDHLEAGI
ncbi:MAG: hypothetical protein OJF50_001371 [Nitrospira sp.]|jgi:hypothetical protein|nr:hypothetical protein [Nitrospira sp.]